MKIEVGKTYEVCKDVFGYNRGDKLEITVIDGNIDKVEYLTNEGVYGYNSFYVFDRLELKPHIKKTVGKKLENDKPAHYDTAIDTIAFAKANFSREQVEGFMRINAVKYIQRYEAKNGVDDVRKAVVYLNMLIEHLEEEGK